MALLKVNFDNGRDHLDMFLPFVLASIRDLPTNNFDTAAIKQILADQHALDVPGTTVSTLLTRATRLGFVRREAGRYLRLPKVSEIPPTDEARRKIEQEQRNVAEAMVAFATTHGMSLAGVDDALELLLGFFEQFHISMLVDEPGPALLRARDLSRKENAMVARFLQSIYDSDPVRTEYVNEILEGFVLQNALLLKDVNLAARRFQDLEIFLDTGFLLRALGLAGSVHAASARESLELFSAAGARLRVFRRTIEEIERILRAYERKLASAEGMKSLWPSDVTRHFLRERYSPSDVAQAIALLGTNLRQLGIRPADFPSRDPRFVEDEPALTQQLARDGESELEPRVVHDVDAVAAIGTLRQGRYPDSLDTARAVFATTSTSVVRTVRAWYKAMGRPGVPPVVHAWALSNIAWLKRPARASGKKLHELVAICAAALRPGPKIWRAFVDRLKGLERSGEITSSEHVALIARELAEGRLAELDDDLALESTTIDQVIESARAEHTAALSEVRDRAATDVSVAQADAAESREQHRQLQLRVLGWIKLLAAIVATAVYLLLVVIVAAGLIVGLPGVFPSAGWLRGAAWVAGLALAMMSLWNLLTGEHLWSIRTRIRSSLERWLANRFLDD